MPSTRTVATIANLCHAGQEIFSPGRCRRKEMNMRAWMAFLILMWVAVGHAEGQTPSSDYQPGTITAVTAHQAPGQHETEVTQYDVSVQVGDTKYVVLFTPPNGSNTVKYSAGNQILVLVGTTTLTFNSSISGKTEVPILSREAVPAKSLDVSQACGGYFSKKMEHLSEILTLTGEQETQVKPIFEQEAGEVGQICFNSALTREEKLDRFKKIVRTSDAKITPLLSASQVQKLRDLRKEQKRDLDEIIAKQKS